MKISEFQKRRVAGELQTDIVELWIDDEIETWRDNQVQFAEGKVLTVSQARAFVGLSVFIHTKHYSEKLVKTFENLQRHASYILVAITDFESELGFDWRKQ